MRRSIACVAAVCWLPALAQVTLAPAPTTEAAKSSESPASKDSQPAATLDRVEVVGPSGENDQRRASTASKIIINKDEIERYGDSSVSEVLKRLPGVTWGGRPGRGGDVRMRGMGGGYTQLLVNGERMPPGFSLDNLRTGNRVLDQHETGFTSNKRDGVNINGRVQLSLGEGESVLFTPFVVASKSAISSESRLDQAPGQR